MNRILTVLTILTLAAPVAPAQSQPARKASPTRSTTKTAASTAAEFLLTRTDAEAHMRFLASDELQGRRTGDPGNATAARYIAEQFRQLGLKPAGDGKDYFQRINLERLKATSSATLTIGKDTLRLGKEVVVIAGGPANVSGDVVYVGYGLSDGDDGYKGRDVKGRIVVALSGSPEAKRPGEVFRASAEKRRIATGKGATALVELYTESIPWGFVSQYFGREQINLPTPDVNTPIAHLWVNNANNQYKQLKEAGQTVTIRVSGQLKTPAPSANVAGLIEGTDPALKAEYVVLSAHFDHVGVGKQGGSAYQPTDSIFNGARDNAFGTVAILSAAKALMQQRPKRSVLVLALTGEEVGLLGSRYYAEHPLVPLKQTVFALNTDGAGYSDTTLISVIGLERTGARPEIEAGAKAFGLGVFAEPAPEQGLFDRSDNVSFAAKGVPSPDIAPGFKTFDEAIGKYYHQAIDNPESLSFGYLHRFCQSYAHMARLIADRPTRPQWQAGDKYEAAGKALYGQ